jgi:hypothetical protein
MNRLPQPENHDDFAAARHRGVSLWRDLFEPHHWIVVFFGRWYLHVYGWGRPYKRHIYWIKVPGYRGHLNDPEFPEFKRVPV